LRLEEDIAMSGYSQNMITRCALDAHAFYADRAEERLRQQIAWSRERGANDEAAFWAAVLGRLSGENDAALPQRIRLTVSLG
jgi:hypothetical protein